MVSCSVYSSCFEASSLSDMNACLNGETHGPVHILTGGEWHAAEEEFIQKVGEEDLHIHIERNLFYAYSFSPETKSLGSLHSR